MRGAPLPFATMTNSPGQGTSQRALSHRLRAETRALHTAAERAGVMRSLARGELSRERYAILLENLAEIYGALERELDRHRGHAAISWLDRDALRRLGAIRQDLAALGISASRPHVAVPATHEYVERVREIGARAPELLLAHAYVRYLGDLSGGQILAPIVARSVAADGGHVTSFYEFPSIDDVAGFKRHFREQLDRVGGMAASDGIVDEAKRAFRLHERLFRELEQPAE